MNYYRGVRCNMLLHRGLATSLEFVGGSSSFFIHPMVLERNDEVDEKVADGRQSLLKPLVENKYYLQKAALAMATGFNPAN